MINREYIVKKNTNFPHQNITLKENLLSRNRFLVSKGNKYILLNVDNVAYFLYENKITYAVTFNKEYYTINKSMDSIEQEINKYLFFRTNRHTIININAFDYFECYFNGKLIVKLKKQISDPIQISKSKASDFKHWLDN